MIEYKERFRFTNDVGEFTVDAHTEEHPSGYGNGTMLVFDVDSDFPVERKMLFDVRYSDEDIADVARELLRQRFGADV